MESDDYSNILEGTVLQIYFDLINNKNSLLYSLNLDTTEEIRNKLREMKGDSTVENLYETMKNFVVSNPDFKLELKNEGCLVVHKSGLHSIITWTELECANFDIIESASKNVLRRTKLLSSRMTSLNYGFWKE